MKHFRLENNHQLSQKSRTLLEEVENKVGFIPNVYRAIASSENALSGFVELNNYFAKTSFSATEAQIILLATSIENQCGYCVAGHSLFAEVQRIPAEYVEAMRNNQPLSNPKLESLNRFTRSLVKNRGKVSDVQIVDFFDAGYDQTHALQIILGVSIKTFSNLTSILMGFPLDKAFEEYFWNPKAATESTASAA